jgi:hypothetical protein
MQTNFYGNLNFNYMKKILTNWKTSLSGLATIITGIVKIVNHDIIGGSTLILTGLGLVHAQDSK